MVMHLSSNGYGLCSERWAVSSPSKPRPHLARRRPVIRKPYQCRQCSASFTFLSMLSGHVIRRHGPERIACSQCRRQFRSAVALRRHRCSRGAGSPGAWLMCDRCGRMYSHASALENHVALRHEDETNEMLLCELCGDEFLIEETLRTHRNACEERANQLVDELSKTVSEDTVEQGSLPRRCCRLSYHRLSAHSRTRKIGNS